MDDTGKNSRYERLYRQIKELVGESHSLYANMATIAAVLHHKFDYYFWTGFYLLIDGELIVGPYQGPLACIKLKKDTGVCWAGINRRETVIVPDVHSFPGHIACDSRSMSEIVIPLKDSTGKISGVMDVDSKYKAAFNETDAYWLSKIVSLII